MSDIQLIRALLLITLTASGTYLQPLGTNRILGGICGAIVAAAIILFEVRLSRASLKRLIGAAAGSILGIVGAFLISLVIRSSGFDVRTSSFVSLVVLLVMGYVGLIVGAEKGDLLNLAALGGIFGGERSRRNGRLLDTSVIIDGRLADVAATGFIDGTLLVPQFVLRELQNVADSSDAARRSRGRRGLEILQRLQKLSQIDIKFVEDDFPHLREVDHKLIELARLYECKLVTNDCNLSKLAQLQRVQVLNVNELATSLKPVVLPGELMQVFLLKEGKEPNQAVAYLDDGTMVVVDNARKLLSRGVNIIVTSVLQTTAGKMIFARLDERGSASSTPGLSSRASTPQLTPEAYVADTSRAASADAALSS